MKQNKIVDVYKAMESLASIVDLSTQEQWNIYKLRKELRSRYEFQEERENAIREKYREFADENGNLKDEKAQEFIKELEDLNNLEVELDFTKPQIRLVKGINFIMAEQLEDFIEFIPE